MTSETTPATDGLLLPPRTRMFHIGPPKTGTTALQAAGAATRSELLEFGVRYPGTRRGQRAAVASFIGRPITFTGAKEHEVVPVPSRRAWKEMMDEIEADTQRRIWFGHEYAAGANVDQVRELAEAIGPNLHVVITLRSFTRMLPSIWQEYNKAGNRGQFDLYVKRILSIPPEEREHVPFHVRHDHARLVRRWAGVVGAENVTVVILDPKDHSFSFHAFEQLLGLPHDLLAAAEVPAIAANRGMSAPEIEFVRQINRELRRHKVTWKQYDTLLLRGGFARMLDHRRPGQDEPMLAMSEWAAEQAEANAAQIVDGILASGVRLVGDVANLLEPAKVRTSPEQNHMNATTVPLDAAVQAMVGLMAVATGHNSDFEDRPAREPAAPKPKKTELDHLQAVPAGDLAGELRRRVNGRARQLWLKAKAKVTRGS